MYPPANEVLEGTQSKIQAQDRCRRGRSTGCPTIKDTTDRQGKMVAEGGRVRERPCDRPLP